MDDNNSFNRIFMFGAAFGVVGAVFLTLLFFILIRDGSGESPPKFQSTHSMDWDADDEAYLVAMATHKGGTVGDRAYNILVALNRVWSDDYPNSIKEVCDLERPCGKLPDYSAEEWELSKEALHLIMFEQFDNSNGSFEYR